MKSICGNNHCKSTGKIFQMRREKEREQKSGSKWARESERTKEILHVNHVSSTSTRSVHTHMWVLVSGRVCLCKRCKERERESERMHDRCSRCVHSQAEARMSKHTNQPNTTYEQERSISATSPYRKSREMPYWRKKNLLELAAINKHGSINPVQKANRTIFLMWEFLYFERCLRK